MGTGSMRGAAAIVGVADAASPTGELETRGRVLEAAMIREALDDAGLTLADVDGVCCSGIATGIAEYLGLHPRFVDGTFVGGSSFEVHVEHAAAAIAAGLCEVVVGVYASTPAAGPPARRRRRRRSARWDPTSAPSGRPPYGPRMPMTLVRARRRAGTWRSTARRRSSWPRSRSTPAAGRRMNPRARLPRSRSPSTTCSRRR